MARKAAVTQVGQRRNISAELAAFHSTRRPAAPKPPGVVQQTALLNRQRAAQFEANSRQRVAAAALAPGTFADRQAAVKAAKRREVTYRKQHEAAKKKRKKDAAAVAAIGEQQAETAEQLQQLQAGGHTLTAIQAALLAAWLAGGADNGGLVGWEAVIDGQTTAECEDADGLNFYANDPPGIGLPGDVHAGCRCVATDPFPGAGLVD